MQLGEMLYEGKAKKIFQDPNHSDYVIMEFKDSLTAFNAEKKGQMDGKGQINCEVASLIFRYLKKNGVESHWVSDQENHYMVVKKVEIVPVEVVVRNVLAGSTAKRLGIKEGTPLEETLVEFYYKKDELGDPLITEDHALMLQLATAAELQKLKELAHKVNTALIQFFKEVGLNLVDFKLEFGRENNGNLILADEITPDSCRLWDLKTGEKMDKDRFRFDLGDVKENYEAVLMRLQERWGSEI